MKRLGLSARLYLLLAPLAIVGLAVSWVTHRGLQSNAAELVDARQVKEMAAAALANLFKQDDATKAILLEPQNLEPGSRKIEAYDANVALFQRMEALSRSDTLRVELRRLRDIDERKLRPLDTALLEDVVGGDLPAALKKYRESYLPARNEFEAALNQVGAAADMAAELAAARMQQRNRQSLITIVCALGGGLAVVMGLVFFVARQATRSLEALRRHLGQNIAATARQAEQSQQTGERLAEAATQQASSLEETGASLEEVASMSALNADRAEEGKGLARQCRETADAGLRDVGELAEAMAAVQSSGAGISRILKTIDEIAFQTNILALNASVEAARAGAAGLGFAVVASEVRNLAQRCAAASRETSTLLEQSTQTSSRGTAIGDQVGRGLKAIADQARQVDELVHGIAQASQEQNQGIGQANTAVAQIQQITQQNAARAEEAAAAATEMKRHADSLHGMIVELDKLIGGNPGHGAGIKPAGTAADPAFASHHPRMADSVAGCPGPRRAVAATKSNGSGNGNGSGFTPRAGTATRLERTVASR